jgi:peptidyl-prolyl cis-trans isomerase A (cyclophilin A)
MDFSYVKIPGTGELRAVIETSMGDITIRLFESLVPNTVNNWVGLATGQIEWVDPSGARRNEPLYDDTIFHRVIPDFMVQAGDPQGDGRGGPGYRFRDEFHPKLTHSKPGILSMANSGPNTNGSQFFITEVATPWLDKRHSVFGEVIENVQLVKSMARVPKGMHDKPIKDIILRRVNVFRATP